MNSASVSIRTYRIVTYGQCEAVELVKLSIPIEKYSDLLE